MTKFYNMRKIIKMFKNKEVIKLLDMRKVSQKIVKKMKIIKKIFPISLLESKKNRQIKIILIYKIKICKNKIKILNKLIKI